MTAFTQKSIKLILCCCFIIVLGAVSSSVLFAEQSSFPGNVSLNSGGVLPCATSQFDVPFPGRTINLDGIHLFEAGMPDIITAPIIIDGRLTHISFSQHFITELLYISA